MTYREINAYCPRWWHRAIFWKKWVYPAVFDVELREKAKNRKHLVKKIRVHVKTVTTIFQSSRIFTKLSFNK